MTRRGRTLLLVVVYLSAPAILVLAEAALRLWAPGRERTIVRPVSYDGIGWFEINRAYPAKYFSPGTPLLPEFKPALFRREKAPGAVRIFCLGESSMFGTPYQMTAGIPGILRRQLRHAWPGREIEVVNFGASAINSNVILDLSRELVRFRPDLVILYMGHNEFYGPDGIGAGTVARLLPASIQWKYRLRDLHLVRWLLESDATAPVSGERNLMREVSKGGAVHLGSDDAERIFSLWERNLEAILEVWRENGVPVLVSDVSSNLMFPPFLYDTLAPGISRLTSLRGSGGRFEGSAESLATLLGNLPGRDTTNAFIEYWEGRLALLRGDTVGAARHLCRARDEDLLKFRAPGRINDILRAVCARRGVACVSADSLFARLSAGGIPGDALFWEHLHPTARGYYAIATMLARPILDGRFIPGAGAAAAPPLPFNPDSLGICWLDRAYGDLSIMHLTGRWPFVNYRRLPEVINGSPPEQLAIARAVYDRRIVWDQGCYESASRFWKTGDLRAAATTYEAILDEYPYNYYPLYLLGNLLSTMGDRGRAADFLRRSISSNPSYPQSRLDLGLLLVNTGRFDEAVTVLAAAAALPAAEKSPGLLSGIYYGLGAAKANLGDFAGARSALERSFAINPRNSDARRLLDRIGERR